MPTEKRFHIIDLDTGRIMATGSGSSSKEDAALALHRYLGDFDGLSADDIARWEKEARRDPDEFANSFNYAIVECGCALVDCANCEGTKPTCAMHDDSHCTACAAAFAAAAPSRLIR